MNKKYSLVVFDLDGTLVDQESSWLTLHRYFNSLEETHRNLEEYLGGAIDFAQFMRKDISLWPPRIHISIIEKILGNYSLKEDARFVVNELKQRSFDVMILSAGINTLANMVAQDLGVKYVLSNELETDKSGFLTGEAVFRVDLLNKHEALEDYISGIGFFLDDCVAIGDSQYDKNVLQRCGLGIAIGDDSCLMEVADIVVKNLKEILTCIT
ncbi:HAD-IB family phosphatase [[Eubacterium] cellulosolvens]